MTRRIDISDLDVHYGSKHAVADVSTTIERRSITALIGPSGCGKSTFLRTINRMHEAIPGARVSGRVAMDGVDALTPGLDAVDVRRRIGVVFQRPTRSRRCRSRRTFLPARDSTIVASRVGGRRSSSSPRSSTRVCGTR